MDAFVIAILFCFGLVLLMSLVGLVAFLSWLSRQWTSSRNREVYLSSDDREAVVQLLQRVRGEPDPTQALDAAIVALQNQATLPLTRVAASSVAPAGASTTPPMSSLSVAPSQNASPASVPSTAPPLTAMPTTLPAPAPQRWLALDNITLLLYLGAALFVIAVGVFVGSAWEEIGGLARWAIVASSALAFYGLGEFFIRSKPVLARAGETFRSLGIVLLPLVALAYDRFVLDGNAPPLFWVVAGAVLAALYYALYRWSKPGRLTAYLFGLSLGVVALLLPDVFGISSIWKAHALLVLAGALLAAAWQAERDGSALVARFREGQPSHLIESNLLLGALATVSSGLLWAANDVLDSAALPSTLYFALLTLLLALVSLWFRSAWIAGTAMLASGIVVYEAVGLVSGDDQQADWALLLGWNGLALALFVLAPRGERWIRNTHPVLTGGALFWSVVALSNLTTVFDIPPSLPTTAALLATGFFVATAARFRNSLPLWVALGTLHIAVIYGLQLIGSDSDSLVLPTLVWLALATAWLLADTRFRLGWLQQFWLGAWAVEALWVTFFAAFDEPAAALAGVLLTLGWLVMALRRKQEWIAGAAIAQGVYAIFAVAAWWGLPSNLLPVLLWLPAAALVLLSRNLPAYARRAAEWGGLLVMLFSPLSGYMGEALDLREPLRFAQNVTAQLALLLTAAFWAAWGWARRSRPLVAGGGLLLYALYAWIALERDVSEMQAYSVPLTVLLLSFAWLFPSQRRLFEGISAFVLLVPAAFESVGSGELLYTLLLGGWSLALLALGISLSRRILVSAGSVGLLLAALRQLWSIISELPPGVIIGLVGLGLMIVAIVLTLRRDTLLRLRERGSDVWEQLGQEESR